MSPAEIQSQIATCRSLDSTRLKQNICFIQPAMSPYKPLLGAVLLAGELATFASAGAPYCLPGSACYPKPALWDAFNTTVGGRLIKVTPYGAPCYDATYNAEQCLYLAQNKGSITFRDNLPGTTGPWTIKDTTDIFSCGHVHQLGTN